MKTSRKLRQRRMFEWHNLSLRTDCKHPYLDSGATPIGSADAHPIEKTMLIQDEQGQSRKRTSIEDMLQSVPEQCLDRHSGATDVGITLRVTDIALSCID